MAENSTEKAEKIVQITFIHWTMPLEMVLSTHNLKVSHEECSAHISWVKLILLCMRPGKMPIWIHAEQFRRISVSHVFFLSILS